MAASDQAPPLRYLKTKAIWALLISPVALVFFSSNFVNVGNLAFNLLFSRWMGPALFGDLALVLTIKLALLSLLCAGQMAVSRHVAINGMKEDAGLAHLNRMTFIVLWCVTPVILVLVGMSGAGEWLGMRNPNILLILLISFPFAASLSILRGVVQGRMDLRGMLMSANVEMLVRLGGAISLWQLGMGIEGVTLAIVVSIFAGWAVIADRLPNTEGSGSLSTVLVRTICTAALPFTVLQASQVLLLEGDIFAAKILFDQVTAGHAAALALFQRIEFFACFGLAAVLLPTVAKAASSARSTVQAAVPVMVAFAGVTFGFVSLVISGPELLISALVGPEYIAVADQLIWATAAASAFTLSYLLATYLSAIGDNRGIWVMAAFVPLQLGALFIAGGASGGTTLNDLLVVKSGCQGALTVGLLWFVIIRTKAATSHAQDKDQSCVLSP